MKGARKAVGNGSSISIWHDPWVPNLPGFKVSLTQGEMDGGPATVRDLWIDKSWNLEALNAFYSPVEIAEICNNPIPLYDRVDVWSVPSASNVSPELNEIWKPPSHGVIKVNSDAAIFKPNGVGLGGVMRDVVGDVVASTCLPLHGNFEFDIAEALTMRYALSVAINSGFRKICLETDSLKLHSHLIKRCSLATTFRSIVHDILQLSSYCLSCQVTFVKRNDNRVAHALSKLCSSFNSLRVWMEEVPLSVFAFVMADLSLLID
uniref:RNase H type-1 domain-containing protein n=1 Tax=Chenopodium quinoa TaxID=63459 RepID=A0A803NCU6_CHEQI